MEQDHLGEQYESRVIELGRDDEGDVVATLVRRVDSPAGGKAVLYVHGFSDYFFHPHVADFFVERGFAFYALDLRKAGRSIRAHQTPHYVKYIPEYFADLDAASRIIREDGNESLLVYSHSTGCLTTTLWAHRIRARDWLSGLILNSPFFAINVDEKVHRLSAFPLDIAGILAPKRPFPSNGTSVNVEGMHRDFRGEWDFNLAWKPLEGTPVRLGWLRAVERAQRRLRKGLEITAPILVAASDKSYKDSVWSHEADTADVVLDADAIVRWAPQLGPEVEVVRVVDGRHDLALSQQPARKQFFTEMDNWLRARKLIDEDLSRRSQ